MKMAWVENGVVRDVAAGDPAKLFHPAVAAFYSTQVPDHITLGATIQNESWVNLPPPPPIQEPAPKPPTLAEFERALDAHLDSVAQLRRYDNRITCMVRAGFFGPFRQEALGFAVWVDQCNVTAYAILADVNAGNRLPPETVSAFIAELPVFSWP